MDSAMTDAMASWINVRLRFLFIDFAFLLLNNLFTLVDDIHHEILHFPDVLLVKNW